MYKYEIPLITRGMRLGIRETHCLVLFLVKLNVVKPSVHNTGKIDEFHTRMFILGIQPDRISV
jgi:hypothetical protein